MAIHTFQIKTEITADGEETKVYLDGEMVYEVDKTKYYGNITRNCINDICKIVGEKLGRTVTPRDISTARMLEMISDESE